MLNIFRWWFAQFTLHGGGKGGGGAVAPAPDYRGAAIEQSAASKELATGQTWANRPTLNTPWGQQTWQAGVATDPSTGLPVTSWTSNINLTPEQQQALDAQQRIGAGKSSLAESLMGQVGQATATPFNWQGLGPRPVGPGQAAEAGNVQDAQARNYQTMSAMLQPGRAQREEALNARLMASGVDPNSEQARRARAGLQEQFTSQDKQMLADALAGGRADVTTQYGMGQQQVAQQSQLTDQQARLRQQAIAEEAQRRGMPLSELNALLTGQQVNMPQMPGFSQAAQGQAPQLLNAAQAQGNYQQNAAQMAQGGGTDWGSTIGTIATVAGVAMMMSDARLKRDIVPLGGGWYEFSYLWSDARHVGVMAQEVLDWNPEAVHIHPSGFLMVDYGRL